MVYSPFQQFRFLHSQKPGSGRPKKFCKEWYFKGTKIVHQYTLDGSHINVDENYQQFYETLVGHIKPNDKLIKIEITAPTIPFNNNTCPNILNIEYDELLDLLPDPDAFTIIGPVRGNPNLISLRRLRPTDCSICDREHEHENPFIIIYNNAIYWDCRRRDKSSTEMLRLGKIDELNSIQQSREIEEGIDIGEIINEIISTGRDITAQPIPLPPIHFNNISPPVISLNDALELYRIENQYERSIMERTYNSHSNTATRSIVHPENRAKLNIRIDGAIQPDNPAKLKIKYKPPVEMIYKPPVPNIIYHERYLRPIEPMQGITLLHSYMGTGKTTQIIKLIQRHNFKRILYIAPRRMFASSIKGDLNRKILEQQGFTSYLDIKASEVPYHDRLIIQVESLWKLGDEINTFDLLVLDELESIRKQLSSFKTMKQNSHICIGIFERLVKETPIVIGADAFLKEQSIKILNYFKRRIKIIRNTWLGEARKCSQFKKKRDFFRYIIRRLKKGKNIIMPWASRNTMEEFIQILEREIPFIRYIAYDRFSSKGDRQRLENVNEIWAQYQLVMYTPTITVGVNFDMEHFDELAVYGSAMSAPVRDIMQGMMRARHIRFKKMSCYLYTGYTAGNNRNLPITYGGIKKQLLDKESRTNEFAERHDLTFVKWENQARWCLDNHIYNIQEEHLSIRYYQIVFDIYLKECNYQKEIVSDSKKRMEELEKVVKDQEIDYCDIPDVAYDSNEYKKLKDKLMSGEMTIEDRKIWEKNQFNLHIIKNTPIEIKAKIFEEYWMSKDRGKQESIRLMYEQKNYNIKYQFMKDASIGIYKTNSPHHAVMNEKLQWLNGILGLEHCAQPKIWLHDEFLKIVSVVYPTIPELKKIFNTRSRISKTNKKLLVKSVVGQIYKQYSHIDFKSCKRDRKMTNGKRTDITPVEYVGNMLVWSRIRHNKDVPSEIADLMGYLGLNPTSSPDRKGNQPMAALIIN